MVDVESYFPCNPWLLSPKSQIISVFYIREICLKTFDQFFCSQIHPGPLPKHFPSSRQVMAEHQCDQKEIGEKSYDRTSILPNAPLHHFLNLHVCSVPFHCTLYSNIVKLWMGAQSRENDMVLLNGWFSYQSVILSGDKLHNLMNILERQFLRRSCLSRFTKYYQNLVENIILIQIERI